LHSDLEAFSFIRRADILVQFYKENNILALMYEITI
jgi:hypothetical protein